MKLSTGLLALSLAGNIALAGFVFLRPGPPNSGHVSAVGTREIQLLAQERARFADLQAALASGDPAKLAAAGCSPEVIKALTVGRAFDVLRASAQNFDARLAPGEKYWQPPDSHSTPEAARERRLAEMRTLGDFNRALRGAYGQDIDEMFNGFGSQRRDFLPPEKRERLRRIAEDYGELEAEVHAASEDSVQLPSDREKLKLLQKEKERDIAEALTPAEREMLDLHTSTSAEMVRGRFGRVLETEEEYKKIYALQKAFDDQFSGEEAMQTPGWAEAREKAEEALNEQFLAQLTPQQIAALRQQHDNDRDTIAGLTRRLNLPEATVDHVLATRERYAALSAQVNADPALSPQQKESRFQELAATGKAELARFLGPQGTEVYVDNSRWLSILENGSAFSVNPNDAPNRMDSLFNTVHSLQLPEIPHETDAAK